MTTKRSDARPAAGDWYGENRDVPDVLPREDLALLKHVACIDAALLELADSSDVAVREAAKELHDSASCRRLRDLAAKAVGA